LILVQNRSVEAKEQRAALRSARYCSDGAAVATMVNEVLRSSDALQLLGDGLLLAMDQHVEGARDAGMACAVRLRDRDWDGDGLLADHLEGLIGTGVNLDLNPLAVDLEDLSTILEGDPIYGGGRIDRRSGEVWPRPAIEYVVEIGDEDEDEDEDESMSTERWLSVECLGSAKAYRDMELFIGTIADVSEANRLAHAVEGRSPFRRFRDALGAWPDDIDRWIAYSEERQRGRAREWLAEHGYCVTPAPFPSTA
jgi:hypothetical protein